MDGLFTTPFLRKYPTNLKSSYLNLSSLYSELHKSISSGNLKIGVQGEDFVDLLDDLKHAEPAIANHILALEAAGKIKGLKYAKKKPEELNSLGVRNSVLHHMNGAFSEGTDTIFHDQLDEDKWRDKIVFAGGKPLFLDKDLDKGSIEYLFKEKSFPQNKGKEFNWSRFLRPFVLPIKKVRILDPWLYKGIDNADLYGIINTLIKKSNHTVEIEIISHLTASSGSIEDQVKKKVKNKLNELEGKKIKILLYNQKGSASKIFHKRVIWTDYWVILSEHGLDFLNLKPGKGTVDKENTLYMTGKYSSGDSLWYQIKNNWQRYLNSSKPI